MNSNSNKNKKETLPKRIVFFNNKSDTMLLVKKGSVFRKTANSDIYSGSGTDREYNRTTDSAGIAGGFMKKKLLGIVLCLAMIIGMFPMGVKAAEPAGPTEINTV